MRLIGSLGSYRKGSLSTKTTVIRTTKCPLKNYPIQAKVTQRMIYSQLKKSIEISITLLMTTITTFITTTVIPINSEI